MHYPLPQPGGDRFQLGVVAGVDDPLHVLRIQFGGKERPHRHDHHLGAIPAAKLGNRVKAAHGRNRVAVKLQAQGQQFTVGVDVQDAAAAGDLAGDFHPGAPLVAQRYHLPQ